MELCCGRHCDIVTYDDTWFISPAQTSDDTKPAHHIMSQLQLPNPVTESQGSNQFLTGHNWHVVLGISFLITNNRRKQISQTNLVSALWKIDQFWVDGVISGLAWRNSCWYVTQWLNITHDTVWGINLFPVEPRDTLWHGTHSNILYHCHCHTPSVGHSSPRAVACFIVSSSHP